MTQILLPLLLAALAAIFVPWLGRTRSGASAPAAIASSLAVAGTLVWAALSGGGRVDVAWLPSWGWRLQLSLDALGGLYAGLTVGVAVPILAYAWAYLPHHLEERGVSQRRQPLFYGWMLAFLASMLGLAVAADLILLFVFFDATAVCSWALIGFDREDEDARRAASTALLVTAASSVAFLVGILLLHSRYGTLEIAALAALGSPDATTTTACALVAVGALAKSAQVPLHFWLPRAMAAPTPVSAYLHSAAMVAAGVFVLHRLHPLLPEAVRLGVATAGWASVLVGGALALIETELKRILAWSTVAHYGHVAVLLGIGGAKAASAAAVYVAVHAVAKSTLFLVAGAVTRATGQRELDGLGGLLRRQPLLAVAAGLGAAALAGLPGTAGFFKDEGFFGVTSEAGRALGTLAVAALALTVAYMARFWCGIFLGPSRGATERVPRRMGIPVAALALLLALGGFAGESLARIGREAAAVLYGSAPAFELAYHLDLRETNRMALAGWALGALLFGTRRAWSGMLRSSVGWLERFGAARAWDAGLRGLDAVSDRLHAIEMRDLRDRVASVLAPAGALLALALFAGRESIGFAFGRGLGHDLPLAVALVTAAAAALAVLSARSHLGIILLLTAVGFALAAVFALQGAPDVALVMVLVETALTLLFVGALGALPGASLDREVGRAPPRLRARWHSAAALVCGGVALPIAWAALSSPGPPRVAARLVAQAPAAHAENVVAAILADFRGLDTLGEVSVVVVAMLGLSTLLVERRRRP